MRTFFLPALFLFLFFTSSAQSPIDVLHYKFSLDLNDENDTIRGKAEITVKFLAETPVIEFDLHHPIAGNNGMFAYKAEGSEIKGFTHSAQEHKVRIFVMRPRKAGDTATFTIFYKGIPADGLIISKSKFGKRTFFSDNWPDRAKHWIPCVDNVADKASVEFLITAPSQYKVISNGELVEETSLPENRRLTHWREDTPIPTKVMAIGVAEFAVQYLESISGTQISSWVFPENKDKGFHDYAIAQEVLQYLINYIGPYPFSKLANVQSKTIFGGMENANAIFYAENTVNGKRNSEGLFAHEIAHQWFGNMVTEKSYAHLWLSEGFATYLSHLYLESKYGKDTMMSMMRKDRQQVINFAKTAWLPLVDSTSSFMALLNANSYQKGGWVLHMLRGKIGDEQFRQVIRKFNELYSRKNAESKDFIAVAESITGMDLQQFFYQWLHVPGIPKLKLDWEYDKKNRELVVEVSQVQEYRYELSLDILTIDEDGKKKVETLQIKGADETFRFKSGKKIVKVTEDPLVNLLASFE